MLCGCPVISSDIAVHREIYQDAAAFFNPYSVDDAVRAIGKVVAAESNDLRLAMRTRGRAVGAAVFAEKHIAQVG